MTDQSERKTRDYQVGGDHYTTMRVQPWEAMQAWMSPEQYRGFLRGNAIKYLARTGRKGADLADLKKAAHYLEELLGTYKDQAQDGPGASALERWLGQTEIPGTEGAEHLHGPGGDDAEELRLARLAHVFRGKSAG